MNPCAISGEVLDGRRRFDYSQRRLGWREPGVEKAHQAFRRGKTPGSSGRIDWPDFEAWAFPAPSMTLEDRAGAETATPLCNRMVMEVKATEAGRKSTRALTFRHPWGNFRYGTRVPPRAL